MVGLNNNRPREKCGELAWELAEAAFMSLVLLAAVWVFTSVLKMLGG
jgi:hypothetical protein